MPFSTNPDCADARGSRVIVGIKTVMTYFASWAVIEHLEKNPALLAGFLLFN
jgi:hypothetical protein